jgi:hypothetical protein
MKNDQVNLITADRIDELGALLKQIKELTDKAEKIKNDIKDFGNRTGERRFSGNVHSILFTEYNTSTVAWKALAEELQIPADLIAKHTTTGARFKVELSK